MSAIKWFLLAVFGLFGRKYSKEWDCNLESLIDSAIVSQIDDHTITFDVSGDGCELVDVWVANKFYAYGHQWFSGCSHKNTFRPSFRVAKKLYKLELELRN